MPNMPKREMYLFIWLFIDVFDCLYMHFNVLLFVYIFTHKKVSVKIDDKEKQNEQA